MWHASTPKLTPSSWYPSCGVIWAASRGWQMGMVHGWWVYQYITRMIKLSKNKYLILDRTSPCILHVGIPCVWLTICTPFVASSCRQEACVAWNTSRAPASSSLRKPPKVVFWKTRYAKHHKTFFFFFFFFDFWTIPSPLGISEIPTYFGITKLEFFSMTDGIWVSRRPTCLENNNLLRHQKHTKKTVLKTGYLCLICYVKTEGREPPHILWHPFLFYRTWFFTSQIHCSNSNIATETAQLRQEPGSGASASRGISSWRTWKKGSLWLASVIWCASNCFLTM